MRITTTILIITLIFVLISISTPAQTAQTVGCCCDAIGETGSFKPQNQCPTPLVFSATNFQTILTLQCVCVQATTPIVSTQPETGCTNPLARAPVSFTAQPVKGKLANRLEFLLPCQTDYVVIERCQGQACTNFQQINLIPPQTFYVDDATTLRWNTDYTYKITARYNLLGDSEPATATTNTGDIECGYQYDLGQFCIDTFSYGKHESYLTANGYLGTAAQTFRTSFNNAVLNLFNSRFRKAFTCDQQNKLSSQLLSCNIEQNCVVQAGTARCMDSSQPCTTPTNIFGMFSTIDNCEGTIQDKKYCFIDKSFSIVDTCYPCSSRMQCYDYKSEGACVRNNCGLGNCSWKPIFEDIGVGVCIDARFNNCPFCNQQGTDIAPNKAAFNNIFDACTEQKATALSTEKNPCFFQELLAGQAFASTCDTITCRNYTTKAQCSANLQHGVTLAANNSIATPSQDMCGLKVCQWSDDLGCVKNADGTPTIQPHWQDCDTETCEKDYFHPITTILPTGTNGRYDKFLIKVIDHINRTTITTEKQGTANYTTFVCVYKAGGTPCTQFTKLTTTQLNINDATLQLQDGTKPIGALTTGQNILRYYTTDPAKNIETIKEVSFNVCQNCAGPLVLNVTVNNSRFINGIYYTSDTRPIIIIKFNKQSDLTSITLNGTTFIPLSKTTTPEGTEFVITTTSAQQQLTEGTYTLTFNAKDMNGNFMDKPFTVPLVVRTSTAKVSITPSHTTVVTTNTAALNLNFSEPVSLVNVTIQEEVFVGDYVKKYVNKEITGQLTTRDNKTYILSLTGLTDGPKNIKITASDLTGAPIIASSTFYINTKPPHIMMTYPRFGIAPAYVFNVTIETSTSRGNGTNPSVVCKWVYDTPTAPNNRDFTNFANFDITKDNKHIIKTFNKIPVEDTQSHPLHVYCKDDKGDITQKTFQIKVDKTTPNILTAFAAPNPITEEYFPNSKNYQTTLKLQTDKLTFCKYSAFTNNFDAMEGQFPGYEEEASTVHLADVFVTEQKSLLNNVQQDATRAQHTYFAQCQSIAGITSTGKTITFNINTNVNFTAKSMTQLFSNKTNYFLSIETNKRAYCYYGTDPNSITSCMGNCNFTTTHLQPVNAPTSGNITYYVQCTRAATGETTPLMKITTIVDTTPPKMTYVKIEGLSKEQDISPYKDKLIISFLGKDEETPVTQYVITVKKAKTGETILNSSISARTDGKPFLFPEITGLNLADKEKYIVTVRPVNTVGLVGDAMESTVITTDFSKQKPGKLNGENCKKDTECASNFCQAGTCAQASCTDDEQNGFETDTDCGGEECELCEQDQKCRVTSDCTSGLSCHASICKDMGPCFDAIITETELSSETDIDCGGACPQKCAEGKKCRKSPDCEDELFCITNTCTASLEGDSDGDGVPDDIDACPNTATEETTDNKGCASSQKYSMGDEIPDSWRLTYFKCIECAEAAGYADPDNDRLTNIEEYNLGSDPTNQSSPKEPTSQVVKTLLWTLLILLVLGAIGIGGYALYKYYESTKEKIQAKQGLAGHRKGEPLMRVISIRPETIKRPTSQPSTPQKAPLIDKIQALRKFMQPKAQTEKEEWIPYHALPKEKSLPKKEKVTTPVFRKLKELALKKLTPTANKKLSKEEKEQVMKKLRQTAQSKKK